MELTNKVALVFAATGDVAHEVAKTFALHGAIVYLSGRDLEKTKKISDAINADGGNTYAHNVDATNENEVAVYVNNVFKEAGRIDIVFNGIGITPTEGNYGTPFVAMAYDKFLLPVNIHVGSQFLTAKTVAPYMMQAKSGVILTLSASIGKEARPFMAGISTACAAIEGMTRVLAAEMGMSNVRVICLRGGAMFETRTIQNTMAANAKTAGMPVEVFGDLIKQSALLKRAPTVKEVANVAAFLVSDRASAMTGQVINVSAGLVLH